jgi:ribosomal protein L3 glutamine methyltransferase
LKAAPDYLAPDGLLICEIGAARPAFEKAYPKLDVMWLDTETTQSEVFAVSRQALSGSAKKNAKKTRA